MEEAEDEEGESEETDVAASPKASEAPNIALSNKPLLSQAKLNLVKLMEKMTQFIGQLTQVVSPRENARASALKTQSMKAPDYFDGTQAHK
ncbi:hypothetical protein O181_078604 [Austropuccinia psidii MF-1]|uniref:Uncharacterized protein n=1 Tax=Austropuccinia psidii MF-1 TaxID=1389203 RepID=A0A9Q3FGU7_9BASI|nr:hypothetical protein [Austropuccinia psidii MF-1]